jgi:uncharacterized SAM-binding protein YcdF (DUF218 family)
MFLFKKLVAPLLFPVPIILVLLVIGLFRMYIVMRAGTDRKRRGRIWILAATVVLVLFSFRPIPSLMMSSLESQYPPLAEAPDTTISWVVVLAGGASDDPRLSNVHRLASSTTVRLVEGIRLWRQLPNARLVLSGGAPFTTVPGAALMRSLAVDLGVPDSSVVIEDRSLDTKDQALAVRQFVGDEPFLLITSASHMPRSMAMFEKQGLAPVAAPTEILTKRSTRLHPGSFYPSSLNIRVARLAWREYMGLIWARLRGQV